MAELTYREAVAAGIAQEMARDERVVFLGEDVAAAGGVFKATVGLLERFGPTRVRDTPISEQAILGAAMGAAMTGLRPIAAPMIACSLIGVSRTRSAPNRSWRPSVVLKTPPAAATSSPRKTTISSRASSCAMPAATASR